MQKSTEVSNWLCILLCTSLWVSQTNFLELLRILGQKYIIWVHFPEYTYTRNTYGGYVFFSDKKLEVFGCSYSKGVNRYGYSTSSECGARLVKDKLHILRKSPIISVKLTAELWTYKSCFSPDNVTRKQKMYAMLHKSLHIF